MILEGMTETTATCSSTWNGFLMGLLLVCIVLLIVMGVMLSRKKGPFKNC